MATIFNNKDRRVVPNWRSFKRTINLGELNLEKDLDDSINSIFSLDRYYNDWRANKSIANAGDLISAAISNNAINDPVVIEVAEYCTVKLKDEHAPILLKTAESLLNGFQQGTDDIVNNTELELFSLSTPKENIYREIHLNRQLTNQHPHDAILYVEASRLYISIGLFEQAIDKMLIALHLAPYNRFVVRSAVRLFLHIGEPDRAYHLLRQHSKKNDPWLLASEVSVATILNKNQVSLKKGVALLESNNYNPRSTSELASAIATVDLLNGSFKTSRKFFSKSLIDPNDNAVAQVQWANKLNANVPFDPNIFKHSLNLYEARAWHDVLIQDYDSAIHNASKWSNDMPFATTPIHFSFHIANTYLKNYALSEKILLKGLDSNITDNSLKNNLAYIHALNNEIEKAARILESINLSDCYAHERICLKATKGLLKFRSNEITEGRKLYLEAIGETAYQNKKPELNWSAVLNYAREELLINSEYSDNVMTMVSKIPDNIADDAINILKKEVLTLNEKRKLM